MNIHIPSLITFLVILLFVLHKRHCLDYVILKQKKGYRIVIYKVMKMEPVYM